MHNKAEIDQVLRQKTDAREIPGVVAIAANSKDVIYQGAFGKRDLSKDAAMTSNSVFWIASMTKVVTTAAAMQLVEQGKLALDAPIGKLLPDLAALQRNVDTTAEMGFIKSRFDVKQYADLSLVEEANKRLK